MLIAPIKKQQQKDFFFKSEAELTASVLAKRSKTHKRLKECFLSGWNRTQSANFRGWFPQKCEHFVLFRPIKKRFFNHLGVLDLCAYVSHHSYVCSSLEVMKRYLIMWCILLSCSLKLMLLWSTREVEIKVPLCGERRLSKVHTLKCGGSRPHVRMWLCMLSTAAKNSA